MADHRHTARVLLNEARARRGTAFAATLLRWAKNARARSLLGPPPAPAPAPASRKPIQPDLFNTNGGSDGSG